MKSINLLKQHPNLIEKCREWDCGYAEALVRLSKNTLEGFINDTDRS
jgi:hypothetical protein